MNTAIVVPSSEYLQGYIAALEAGWSANTLDPERWIAKELRQIRLDSDAFLAGLEDRAAVGGPVQRTDGSTVPRLPGFRRWIWDGEFCGSISLQWQPGTDALPDYVLGHIGYSVVPWKQRQGHATRALALMLKEARDIGLRSIEIVTTPENIASQRVITTNGGTLIERFDKAVVDGGGEALRFRIDIS